MATKVLSTSQTRQWFGFPFKVSRGPVSGTWTEFEYPSYWLAVILRGSCSVRVRAGRWRDFSFTPGSFAGHPPGRVWDELSWRGAVEVMVLNCNLDRLRGCGLSEHEPLPSLSAAYPCATDRAIAAIAGNMLREFESGSLSGRIYAESLSLALAARLDGIAREMRGARTRDTGPVLPTPKARLVSERIEASLAQDLSIADLAGAVGMSPSHFSTCFRNTFELPVHQYVMNRRIEHGSRLLATSNFSNAEIALECGFASQSHFTQAFRRMTGTTPTRYRRGLERRTD